VTLARSRGGDIATWLALALLAACAALSNTRLFRQEVQGTTDLTRGISANLGEWSLIGESPASASEVRGLETRDVIKRTYTNGQDVIELVVAYIAHSSRKSAHAQEACLRGSGALVGRIESRQLEKSPVLAKSISIDLQDRRQQVYYWYKIGGSYTANYLSSSLKMFFGGLMGSKNHGATLIRLLTPVKKGENQSAVDERLEAFTARLLPELERCLP
jgi:EpsI family protein